ncbi:spherulation-specific family 4 protein [Paracidovorax anthurii]|uniref:Spherulation-specific family 4 protein n=1 Tax=Paracidovorax anthurii TaxID=78229 RepID=A0A328YLX5_9BURK|nr:spherulation-specific family 4 protein [Paracidovorax anthurii]RAR74344.1 spherulation-specific family 4 protein [Paracidovorax anthurii]
MHTPTAPSSCRWIAHACALLVACLLSACGGSSDSDTASSQSAQAQASASAPAVALAFTAPGDGDVFNTGTSVAVGVQALVGGQAAPDGTAVVFTAASGSFAPNSAATLGGAASTTLATAATGPLALNASATLGGQTASASRTVYVRPTPSPLEVLVPAYFYPSAGSPWDALTAGTSAYPSVAVTAILNPSNGVFTKANPEFTAAATAFVQAGGKLLGYVYTSYGSRSASKVKGNIDKYLSLYGQGLISGIFIDEMSTETRRLAYYRDLFNYIKGKDASLRVVGNPGTMPNAAYADIADTFVTFENQSEQFAGYDPRASGGWLYRLSNTHQSALLHNTAGCAAMQQAVLTAATARYNTGPLYVTDDSFNLETQEGNPWDTLPSYWTRFLGTVDAVNRGATLPAC